MPTMIAEHTATTTTYSQSGDLTSVSSIELDSSASTNDVGITSRIWTETSGDGGSFDDDTAVAPTYTPVGNGPWTFQVEGEDIDSNTDTDIIVVLAPNGDAPVSIEGAIVPSG